MCHVWRNMKMITFNDVRITKEWPVHNFRYVLKQCGEHLESLELYAKDGLALMSVVAEHCKKLKCLSLHIDKAYEDDEFHFLRVFQGNTRLQSLTVVNVPIPFWSEYEHLLASLKHLELQANDDTDPLMLVCISYFETVGAQ